MSGFEVAGVVLGVLPIVIGALSDYREEKGVLATFTKFRGLLESLIHQLKTQKTMFYLQIVQLLREARVREIVDDVDPTEERCVAVLRDARAGAEISKYLGQLYMPFLEILGYYEKYLKDITAKLGHITRLETASLPKNCAQKDDLDAILRANEHPKGPFRVRGRFKFSIDRQSLDALVKDLRTERYSLENLMKGVKAQRDWEASEPSRGSTKMAQAFSRVRAHATSLYTATCRCLICDCHDQHSIMIRLEHRISSPSQTKKLAPVKFRLCYPIKNTLLQEVEVMARANQHGEDYAGDWQKKAKSAESRNNTDRKLPAITFTEPDCSASHAIGVRVANMCDIARKARECGQILALELVTDMLHLMQEATHAHQSFISTVTLADFLVATASDPDTRMTPKQQALLVLDVATAILQLRQTSWSSSPWNSRTILFLVGDDGRMAESKPYVEQAFDAASLAGQLSNPGLSTQEMKGMVLELAILMLEILHHTPIETWAGKNHQGSTATFWERMKTATRWLELSSEKLLPHHLNVIEACLAQCVKGHLLWDFEFQKLYCENVVKPLQQLVYPQFQGY